MRPALKIISQAQRHGWYFSSAIYGFFIGLTLKLAGYPLIEISDDLWGASVTIFIAAWTIGIIGLRFYIQDKDPTDFFSVLGIQKK